MHGCRWSPGPYGSPRPLRPLSSCPKALSCRVASPPVTVTPASVEEQGLRLYGLPDQLFRRVRFTAEAYALIPVKSQALPPAAMFRISCGPALPGLRRRGGHTSGLRSSLRMKSTPSGGHPSGLLHQGHVKLQPWKWLEQSVPRSVLGVVPAGLKNLYLHNWYIITVPIVLSNLFFYETLKLFRTIQLANAELRCYYFYY